MFFGKNNENEILKAIEIIKGFVNGDTNKIDNLPQNGSDRVLSSLSDLARTIESKQTQELAVYGEIMLVSEKLADGLTDDRISAASSNQKLNYIAKTINSMAAKLDQSLTEIDTILDEYANQNFMPTAQENLFETGKLKYLPVGINKLRDYLTQSLQITYRSSNVLIEEANEVFNSMEKLVLTTQKQTSDLEEANTSVGQISENINKSYSDSKDMSSYGNKVQESIKEGLELANETVTAMNGINESTQAVNEAITIIDQIAFQTNILSLNAAVEAATAGEAGKGFAVVAQEVRNLASRSAEAAKDIKDLVEKAANQANEGKSIADEMIKGYDQLNENSEKTIELIQSITSSTNQQQSQISHIQQTISLINEDVVNSSEIASRVKIMAADMQKMASKNAQTLKDAKFEGRDESLRTFDDPGYHGSERRKR